MRVRGWIAWLLLLVSATAWGKIGTIDNVPASTLLYPHFEVDTSSAQGVNTILTLQNASATAILAHVVLWTDLGLPTARFDIYLTGYDHETIDLGNVFRRRLPVTGSDGQDPSDTISPQGPISQDINFASCNTYLPNVQNGSIVSRGIVDAHRGIANGDYFDGLCGAKSYGDNIARGYVTIDTTNSCSILAHDDPSYLSSVVTFQNTLMGDYVIVDPANGRMFAESAVHIETSFTDPIVQPGPNKQTFYGRFVNFGAIDRREPLPTAWVGRVANGRTDISYWRDPGTATAPFTCGGSPAGLPTGQRAVSTFNAAGTATGMPTGNLFPFATGAVDATTALGATAPLGWIFANLNLAAPSGPLGAVRQSWMTFQQVPSAQAGGSGPAYSVPGIQLGNAATGADPVIP